MPAYDDLIPSPSRRRGAYDDLLPGGAPATAERPAEAVELPADEAVTGSRLSAAARASAAPVAQVPVGVEMETPDFSTEVRPGAANWGDVVKAIPGAAAEQARLSVTNLRRMANEEAIQNREAAIAAPKPEGTTLPGRVRRAAERQRQALEENLQARPEIEADAKAAAQDMAAATPSGMDTLQQGVFSAGASAPTTLAATAVGLATRNPELAMTIAGAGGAAQQAGTTYGEARDKGATHSKASLAATIDAAIEGLDALPIGVALKPGSAFVKRMAKSLATEGLTESGQQALQDLRAMAMENPELTLGEVWQNMKVAGVAGVVGGTVHGSMGGIADAARKSAAAMHDEPAPAAAAPVVEQAPAQPAPVVQEPVAPPKPAAPVASTAPAGAYDDLLAEAHGLPAEEAPQVRKVLGVVDTATSTERPEGKIAGTTFRTINEDEAAKLKEGAGIEVAGFEHFIDEDAVRHILKDHGDPAVEESRGNVAVTPEDFAKLPLIVNAQQSQVQAGKPTAAGQPTVIYTRQIGDTFYAVEAVRKKKRRLALVTMWKTRAAPRATPEGGVAHTSETLGPDSDASVDLPDDTGNRGMPAGVAAAPGHVVPVSITPAAGGTTPPVKTQAAVSAEKARPDAIRAAMQKLFGAPINEKGLSKKYLGIYKIKPQTVRLQNRNDIRTAGHEIGHHISNTDRPFRKIMRAHQAELVSIAPRAYIAEAVQKYGSVQAALAVPEMRRHLIEEGFAEFIAEYLTAPAALQAKTPGFHQAFETWLGQNPEKAAALAQVQGMIGAHQALSPAEKILAKVGAFTPSLGSRAAALVSKDTWNTFAQATLDKWHPLKEMVADLMPGAQASKNPYIAARLLSGDAAVIEDWVTDFTSPFDYAKRLDPKNYGRSLKDILTPIFAEGGLNGEQREQEINNFKAYLIARRAAELKKVGKENLLTDQEIADALKLETIQPNRAKLFETTARMIYAYNDQLLDYAVEGGLLSQETADKFKQYANYIPFFREPEGEAKGGGRGQPFKRLTGGTQNLRDPIANLIQNTANIIHATNRNAMVGKAAELARAVPGGGRWLEDVKVPQEAHQIATERILEDLARQGVKIDTSMAQGMAAMQTFFTPSGKGDDRHRIVVYKDKGALKAVQVNDPLLWKSLGNIPPLEMNILLKMIAAPAQTLRAGVVLDPTFMVRNFVRDTLSSAVQSKGAFIPGLSTAQGIKLMAQQKDAYKLWRAFGGGSSDQFHDPDDAAKTIERMAKRGGFDPGSIISPVRWLDALKKLGSFTESGSRIGEFAATYKPGDFESALQAALNAREVSTDFGMKGGHEAIQVLTRITPFMNPAMQGLYKTARVLSGADGKAQAGKAAMVGGAMALASVALALLNSDEDWYKRLEEWEKTTYWHVKLGDQVFRLPKPFEYGTLFASIPEAIALRAAEKEGGEDFKKRILQALGQVFGFRVIPQAATIVAEPWANKSLFTGRKIVPDKEQHLEPGLQSNPGTTKVAQLAGEAANVSPAVIDNMVRNVFGTIGVHVSTVADLLLEKAGVVAPSHEKTWQSWPVLKAFVRDPENPNTKQQKDFYDTLDKYRTAVATVRELKERGQDDKAEAYAAEHSDELGDAKAFEATSKRLAKLRRQIAKIERDPDATPAEKRELVRDLNNDMRDAVEDKSPLYQAAKKSYGQRALEGGQ